MKSVKNLIRLYAVTALVLVSTAVLANVNPGNGNPVSVKMVSSDNSQTVFEMKVAGEQNDSYSLTITDQFGNPVYRENIRAASFSKKFVFDTEELTNNNVRLELYNREKKETRVYEVGISSSASQVLLVTEIR